MGEISFAIAFGTQGPPTMVDSHDLGRGSLLLIAPNRQNDGTLCARLAIGTWTSATRLVDDFFFFLESKFSPLLYGMVSICFRQ